MFEGDFDRCNHYLVSKTKEIHRIIGSSSEVLKQAGNNAWLVEVFASQILIGACGQDLKRKRVFAYPFARAGESMKTRLYYEFLEEETLVLTTVIHQDSNSDLSIKQRQIECVIDNGVNPFRSLTFVIKIKMKAGKVVNFQSEFVYGLTVDKGDDAALPKFKLEPPDRLLTDSNLANCPIWFEQENVVNGLYAILDFLDVTNPYSVRISAFKTAKTLVKHQFSDHIRCVTGKKVIVYKVLDIELKLNRERVSIESLNEIVTELNVCYDDRLREHKMMPCSHFILNKQGDTALEFDRNDPQPLLTQLNNQIGVSCLKPLKFIASQKFITGVEKLLHKNGYLHKCINKATECRAEFYWQEDEIETHIFFEADMKTQKSFKDWCANTKKADAAFLRALKDENYTTYQKFEIIAVFDLKAGTLTPKEVIYTYGETMEHFHNIVNIHNLNNFTADFLQQLSVKAKSSNATPEKVPLHADDTKDISKEVEQKLLEKDELTDNFFERRILTEAFSESSKVSHNEDWEAAIASVNNWEREKSEFLVAAKDNEQQNTLDFSDITDLDVHNEGASGTGKYKPTALIEDPLSVADEKSQLLQNIALSTSKLEELEKSSSPKSEQEASSRVKTAQPKVPVAMDSSDSDTSEPSHQVQNSPTTQTSGLALL